jgi:glyoxalase superfamily protein
MATRIQVVIDCAAPGTLAEFWSAVLGYQLQPPPTGYQSWEEWARQAGIPEDQWDAYSAAVDPEGVGPRLFFQRVPEPKVTKNRVHLDVNVSGRDTPPDERRARIAAEVERVLLLGATRLREVDEPTGHCVVLADPEGNEFCLQ